MPYNILHVIGHRSPFLESTKCVKDHSARVCEKRTLPLELFNFLPFGDISGLYVLSTSKS